MNSDDSICFFIYYNNWLEDISAFSSEIIYLIFTNFSILYLLVTFPKNAGDSLLELMWTLDRRMRVKSYFRLSLKFIHKKDSAISSLFPVLAKKKKKKFQNTKILHDPCAGNEPFADFPQTIIMWLVSLLENASVRKEGNQYCVYLQFCHCTCRRRLCGAIG